MTPAANGKPAAQPAPESDPGPLPDDEQVILDEPAAAFIHAAANLVGTDDAEITGRMKDLGYKTIPGKPHDRLVLYRTLRKDMRNDTAEQPVLVDVENGAYAE